MLKRLLDTREDWVALLLRVTLGVVIFPHGAQKLLGWFGGFGFSATLGYFDQALGIPAFLALLVILFEFVGALALIFGVFSRVAAAGIAGIMLGAIFKVHLANGFFMDWSGSQGGHGFEYHLLALALAAAILIKGSGALSLDRKLATATA